MLIITHKHEETTMKNVLSKSEFKPKALKYFRQVQQTGQDIIITDHSKPVLKIVPYDENPLSIMLSFRGSALEYKDPTSPVGEEDWESL